MRNQKKASGFGKDLITDINCVAGWEADFVIYLVPRDVDEYAFMSRFTQLIGRLFSPSQKSKKLSHPFRVCFELGMGSELKLFFRIHF